MWERELAFANELADRAADIGLRLFREGVVARIKTDRTPVTEADLAIEAMVRDAVAERFPDDGVLGEEEGGGPGSATGRVWVVDPIDGTKNFAAGIQVWATLIALRAGDRFVAAVVSAPALGERYEAARGEGARLGGRPIRVSERASVADGMVVHGSLDEFRPKDALEGFVRLTGAAARTRGFGDFWGHVLVARGAAEVMLEPRLRVWDYAALQVVVEEAGGRMTRFDGGALTDGGSVLTTNGAVHDEALALLSGR